MAELDKRKTMKAKTYAAQGGGVAALGVIAAARYASAVPDVSAAEIAAVAAGVPWVINLAVKVALDAIHKRSVPLPLVGLVLLVGMMGCAGLEGQDVQSRPILKRTLLDKAGKVTGSVEVSLLAELVSRGCMALDISPEGEVAFILQQDGSGDWSTVRGLVSIIPETVAVAMNPISTPIAAIVEALSGRPPMEPPSEIHGCAGLYESAQPD